MSGQPTAWPNLNTRPHSLPEVGPPVSDDGNTATAPATKFLESKRLWYRGPESEDSGVVAGWKNDPRIRRTISPVFPISPEAMRRWMETCNPHEHTKANDHVTLMFGLRGENQPIGMTGLFAINWIDRHGEWWILIGDATHWNKGFGREVARRLLQYAFCELNLNRVELRVVASNPGAIRAYQKAGFVHEGTQRQGVFAQGEWTDLWLMGVLRDEWQQGPDAAEDMA